MFNIKQKLMAFALLLLAAAFVIVVFAHETQTDNDNAQYQNALAHDTLPFYSSADLRPRWNTRVSHQITGVALIDQQAADIDTDWFNGHTTIVSFFFSQCATVCPVSMEMLALAQQNMQREMNHAAPKFLSISVTPMSDTPVQLADYARRIGLANEWHLATGIPQDVTRLAHDRFFTDIETPAIDGGPPHTERALLVDAARRIRGIYDVTAATELLRLQNDVRRLSLEKQAP